MSKNPMFNRRHYKAIASVLKDNLDRFDPGLLGDNSYFLLVEAFAKLFAKDNERFNSGKFFDACK